MTRRILWILTIGALAGIFVIPLNPVNDKLVRIVFLGSLGGAWLGFLILFWRHMAVRVALAVVALVPAVLWMLPRRAIDRDELRNDYVRRMSALEGSKYFWGGESARGIDCSGLPRRALRDAQLAYGIRHFDGGSIRNWGEQWWFDASAKALGEGYRNYTKPLKTSGTIATMDYSELQPGDLVVTTGGIHVLAYLGGGKWIQADPGAGEVVSLDGRTSDNGWFSVPVTAHRWSVLDSR